MLKVTEADVMREVLAWLRLRRIWHCRINSGAAQGEGGRRYVRFYEAWWPGLSDPVHAGHPDLMLLFAGFVAYVELKRPGGRLSEYQAAWLGAARAAGAVCCVVTSSQELEAHLRAEGLIP